MGEYSNNYSAEQLPTAPNYHQQQNGERFTDYVLPGHYKSKPVTLQGGVREFGTGAGIQGQGTLDKATVPAAPLKGNVQDSQLRLNIQDNGGIPTYCLRIEDNRRDLDRDVFKSPFTGQVYHNVFIKQSDLAIVNQARTVGTREMVNLYDKTGHIICPVLAGAVGGWFPVGYQPSTVVLNIYDAPGMNNQTYSATSTTNHKHSEELQRLKDKYKKCKPFIQGLLNQIR